jgi:hypothetical protein
LLETGPNIVQHRSLKEIAGPQEGFRGPSEPHTIIEMTGFEQAAILPNYQPAKLTAVENRTIFNIFRKNDS